MSKIRKLIAILLVVLFVVTVTAGAVSAANYMYEKSTPSYSAPAHSSGSLNNGIILTSIVSTQEIKKNQDDLALAPTWHKIFYKG